MKKIAVMFLLLVGLSFASAYQADVTVIDEIGSFSGAVLKVKSPITKDVGDKIYASEYLTKVGIIKFKIETSLSEVLLDIIITKNGEVVADIEEGPFTINGSEIIIDRREKVEVEDLVEVEEVNETIVNETVVANETVEANETNESSEVVVEVEQTESKLKKIYFTGKAMLKKEDGSFNWSYPIGSGVVLLLFSVFVFVAVFRRKPKEEVLSDDEKELQYMEKKVKETAGKIKNIKEANARKAKIEAAKAKLAEEERELKELEQAGSGDKKSEEQIEKQEDVVEKAEDKVEKAEKEY